MSILIFWLPAFPCNARGVLPSPSVTSRAKKWESSSEGHLYGKEGERKDKPGRAARRFCTVPGRALCASRSPTRR